MRAHARDSRRRSRNVRQTTALEGSRTCISMRSAIEEDEKRPFFLFSPSLHQRGISKYRYRRLPRAGMRERGILSVASASGIREYRYTHIHVIGYRGLVRPCPEWFVCSGVNAETATPVTHVRVTFIARRFTLNFAQNVRN